MKIFGWHGGPENLKGPIKAGLSSEGKGVYIAEDRGLAEFFGHPYPVEATIRKPLVVDEEELPGLEDFVARGYFEHMKRSDWINANYMAARVCDLLDLDYDQDPEGYMAAMRECFPLALTKSIKLMGYDGVEIKVQAGRIPDSVGLPSELQNKPLRWWVVFDPKKVKFVRR